VQRNHAGNRALTKEVQYAHNITYCAMAKYSAKEWLTVMEHAIAIYHDTTTETAHTVPRGKCESWY